VREAAPLFGVGEAAPAPVAQAAPPPAPPEPPVTPPEAAEAEPPKRRFGWWNKARG
jgi:hypothetical protein